MRSVRPALLDKPLFGGGIVGEHSHNLDQRKAGAKVFSRCLVCHDRDHGDGDDDDRRQSSAEQANEAALPPSIMVTPFQVIGDREESRFISDGLTEDLIVTLADRTGFRIAAAGQLASLDGQRDFREAGRQARVDFILESSVRTSEDRVRITVLLVSPDSGYHLWGGRYDRALSEVLMLNGDVADSIVATLADKLMQAEVEAMAAELAPVGAVGYFVSGLAHIGRFAEQAFVLPLELYRRATNPTDPA